MVKRIAIASVVTVLLSVLVAMLGELVIERAELQGFRLAITALTAFIAFFAGAKIGGSDFFWPGVTLFFAMQLFASVVISNALFEIARVAGVASQETWLSIISANWLAIFVGLVACVLALKVGVRASGGPGSEVLNVS